MIRSRSRAEALGRPDLYAAITWSTCASVALRSVCFTRACSADSSIGSTCVAAKKVTSVSTVPISNGMSADIAGAVGSKGSARSE